MLFPLVPVFFWAVRLGSGGTRAGGPSSPLEFTLGSWRALLSTAGSVPIVGCHCQGTPITDTSTHLTPFIGQSSGCNGSACNRHLEANPSDEACPIGLVAKVLGGDRRSGKQVQTPVFRPRQIPASFLWKIWVVLDLANLLYVSLRMSGDFQHPLPAIDDLRTVAKAVGAQVVACRLDVFDHSGAERLKLAEGLTQVFIGIDFFVSAACLGVHHAIDSVPHNVGVGVHRFLAVHIRCHLYAFL